MLGRSTFFVSNPLAIGGTERKIYIGIQLANGKRGGGKMGKAE